MDPGGRSQVRISSLELDAGRPGRTWPGCACPLRTQLQSRRMPAGSPGRSAVQARAWVVFVLTMLLAPNAPSQGTAGPDADVRETIRAVLVRCRHPAPGGAPGARSLVGRGQPRAEPARLRRPPPGRHLAGIVGGPGARRAGSGALRSGNRGAASGGAQRAACSSWRCGFDRGGAAFNGRALRGRDGGGGEALPVAARPGCRRGPWQGHPRRARCPRDAARPPNRTRHGALAAAQRTRFELWSRPPTGGQATDALSCTSLREADDPDELGSHRTYRDSAADPMGHVSEIPIRCVRIRMPMQAPPAAASGWQRRERLP